MMTCWNLASANVTQALGSCSETGIWLQFIYLFIYLFIYSFIHLFIYCSLLVYEEPPNQQLLFTGLGLCCWFSWVNSGKFWNLIRNTFELGVTHLLSSCHGLVHTLMKNMRNLIEKAPRKQQLKWKIKVSSVFFPYNDDNYKCFGRFSFRKDEICKNSFEMQKLFTCTRTRGQLIVFLSKRDHNCLSLECEPRLHRPWTVNSKIACLRFW